VLPSRNFAGGGSKGGRLPGGLWDASRPPPGKKAKKDKKTKKRSGAGGKLTKSQDMAKDGTKDELLLNSVLKDEKWLKGFCPGG